MRIFGVSILPWDDSGDIPFWVSRRWRRGNSMPRDSGRSDRSLPQLGDGSGGPAEAAAFVGSALADLKQMSRRHRLDTLTYLLELAHMEADDIVRIRRPLDGG
jgi:hypothetical protein